VSLDEERMLLMNQSAIDALCNQALADGRKEGYEQARIEFYAAERILGKLRELMQISPDASVLDELERIYDELRATRNALRASVNHIELLHKELRAVQQYADEMKGAYEPAQTKIRELNETIVKLQKEWSR
jgi:nucleotidyltransferase/DNA polymerase involved in DNA repair